MPTVTLRKLIRFGKGGFAITLPKGWVNYYKLEAGDRLIVIADGELQIRPEKERRKENDVNKVT